MQVGYARPLKRDPDLSQQMKHLEQAGCARVFSDPWVGRHDPPAGLTEMLAFLRAGDMVHVWRLECLASSMSHLVKVIQQFHASEVGFRCCVPSLDTTQADGAEVIRLFGALAEFENDIVRERTLVGLESARSRGRVGGRPRAQCPVDENLLAQANALRQDPALSVVQTCSLLGISRSTYYRLIRQTQSDHHAK